MSKNSRFRLLHSVKGLRYATDAFLGTLLLWIVLRGIGDRNPVWAIISFIVVSEPDIRTAHSSFVSRFSNTLIGCTTGVLCLLVFGVKDWLLAPTIACTILICTNLIRMPGSWKIAPATSALIITSALVEKSSFVGFEQAIRRAAEVLLGSLVALIFSWLLSKFSSAPANQHRNSHVDD